MNVYLASTSKMNANTRSVRVKENYDERRRYVKQKPILFPGRGNTPPTPSAGTVIVSSPFVR